MSKYSKRANGKLQNIKKEKDYVFLTKNLQPK